MLPRVYILTTTKGAYAQCLSGRLGLGLEHMGGLSYKSPHVGDTDQGRVQHLNTSDCGSSSREETDVLMEKTGILARRNQTY